MIVKSLKDIIGANMVYIDKFLFFDVPRTQEELYQIIGRSKRIGRREHAMKMGIDPNLTADLMYYV